MKEETKKKLCKISKIVGFAITFGFAVFGVLCAAMLIGNGSKKDDIKTLDSSLVQNEVRLERNIMPRKAVEVEEEDNLFFNYEQLMVDTTITSYGGGQSLTFQKGSTWATFVWDKTLMPNGYYLLDGDYSSYSEFCGFFMDDSKVSQLSNMQEGVSVIFPSEFYSIVFLYANSPSYHQYFYLDWGSFDRFCINCRANTSLYLTLVDTIDVPVSSSISFAESFSPLGLFGDSVTNNGGYVYLPNATGNVLSIEITGLIFKYGGVVYDGIHIECVRALSIGYINDDGELVPQGGTEDYLWALSWIKFYQRYKGQSPQDGIVVVMPELKSVSGNAGPVAFTGRTQWVNRSDRTIQIIDDLGTSTGRYEGRYSDMTDKKLMEWVSSSFSIGNALSVMGNNSVFDIFTNAFDSVLPILSIAILPNISLGMLLFIPLIGAIIVIIIRVVKK